MATRAFRENSRPGPSIGPSQAKSFQVAPFAVAGTLGFLLACHPRISLLVRHHPNKRHPRAALTETIWSSVMRVLLFGRYARPNRAWRSDLHYELRRGLQRADLNSDCRSVQRSAKWDSASTQWISFTPNDKRQRHAMPPELADFSSDGLAEPSPDRRAVAQTAFTRGDRRSPRNPSSHRAQLPQCQAASSPLESGDPAASVETGAGSGFHLPSLPRQRREAIDLPGVPLASTQTATIRQALSPTNWIGPATT